MMRIDAEPYTPDHLALAGLMKRLVTQGLAKPIGEIASVEYGYMPMEDYADELAGEPLIRVTNIKNQLSIELDDIKYVKRSLEIPEEKRVRVGDVLLVQLGDTTGKVGYVGDPLDGMVFPSYCLRIRSPKLPGEFLAVFLDSELGQRQLWRLVTFATVRPNTSKPHVQSIIVPLPDDTTLRHIKQAVTRATDLRQESRRLYAEAEALLLAELGLDHLDLSHQPTYTQNFSQAWAAGRLDAEYFQPKYYRILAAISSITGRKGWPVRRIDQISGPLKYGTSIKLEYLREGVPFLRIADVSGRRFSLDSIQYISETQAKQEQEASVKTGDVLVSRSGTLGLAVAIPEYLENAIFGSYFIRVRPDSSQVIPEYLALFINSSVGGAQVDRLSTGAIQTNLTIPAIESIHVPVPPLNIQRIMVQKVLDSFAVEDKAKRLLEEAKGQVEEMVLLG